MRKAEEFKDLNSIQGWNITNVEMNYKIYNHLLKEEYFDGFELVFEIERKSRYYVFKIIMPIILILIVCWSAVWIKPKDLESKLTITIVCLLSLIAYNFVIDKDLPKLEYLPEGYEFTEDVNVFASGKDGIFSPGTPIGETTIDGEVDLFIDPNQLSFVTVILKKNEKKF